jgi:hypothetical protein
VGDAGGEGDVGESAVAIIFEKAGDGFPTFGKSFETPAIHEKNVEPAVVVVIVESDAATGGFEKELVFVFAAVNGLCVEAGFFGDVEKIYAERGGFRESDRRCSARERRANQAENILQREDQSRTAEGFEKPATRRKQVDPYLPLKTRATLWPFLL